MSLKSAPNNLVDVSGKLMLLVQLSYLHVRVYFSVVEKLAVPLLVGTSFIDRFVWGIFPVEHRIVTIQAGPVAIISEYL